MTAHGEYDGHVKPDVTRKANVIIWLNFFLFGFLLFVVIAALTMYFDNALEKERYAKIESVPSKELNVLHQEEAQILSGEKAVDGVQAHISIDEAMKRYADSVSAKRVSE